MFDKLISLLPQKLVVKTWRHLRKVGFLRNIITLSVNKRFLAGVTGLIWNESGEVLIVKHTYKPIPWGLPSGALRREQPREGLAREIREETGFDICPIRILDVLYDKKPDALSVIVEGRVAGGVFAPSAEVSEYRFISPGDDRWVQKLPPVQQEIIRNLKI